MTAPETVAKVVLPAMVPTEVAAPMCVASIKLASSSVVGQTEEVPSPSSSSPYYTERMDKFLLQKMVGPANVGRIVICGT